ncbi:enoyl-CoA hydratase/isomerase family protein [Microbaculum marinum]|uniref:Enoyl-CoA hydratase/isomerase family protein n=1 Tax=Microbaculum marinum TaxID=1764581 RepID=A0AAW9RI63_9HYPH
MTHPAVTIERRGSSAIVRFDRQGRANAIDFAMMDALTEAARSFEQDSDTAAIVLTGAAGVFCGGMDLRDPAFARLDGMSLNEVRALAECGPRMVRAWASVEIPTIAAIEGPCIGGGLALAAICDFRIAGVAARFAAPEVAVGLNMGWHSVPRLVSLIGEQTTRRLLLLGEQWDSDEALRRGFVDEVSHATAALDAALAMAEVLGSRPPAPTRMVKRQLESIRGSGFAESRLDKDQHALAWLSEDFRRAVARFAKSGS